VKRRDVTADDGVSLILALLFITVAFILVMSLFSVTGSALSFSTTAQDERGRVYSADGAVQGAINNARYNLDAGVTNGSCPFTPPAGTNGLSSTDITVQCTALSGSGGTGAQNQPKNAVLTLASGTQEGFVVGGGGSASVGIQGSVFSHSVITPGINVGVSHGNVTAVQSPGCTSANLTVVPPGVKRCGYTRFDPNGEDPLYSPVASSAPAAAAPATCASKNVVKFTPGTYTAAPTNPTTGTCTTATIFWFAPGSYYFAFPDATHTWSVDKNIVAGTPINWDPTAVNAVLPASTAAACDKDSGSGVQFVFGRNSQMFFTNSTIRVELCASASTTSVPIAIFGVRASGGGYTAPTGCIVNAPFVNEDAMHCALLTMANNSNKPDVIVHGTTYAPLAALNVNVHHLNEGSVFEGGVIARAIVLDVSSSASVADLFSLPGSGRTPRHMLVTALWSGTPVVKADVSIDDDSTGGLPGQTVTINSWSATP
jgi:hypothetical protein